MTGKRPINNLLVKRVMEKIIKAIKRACCVPLCPRTHQNRSGYCDDHEKKYQGWGLLNPLCRRGKRSDYGANWRRLRISALERDRWLCQQCIKHDLVVPAVDVDHIIPRNRGGPDLLHNLQSLCRSCHCRKTARESNNNH